MQPSELTTEWLQAELRALRQGEPLSPTWEGSHQLEGASASVSAYLEQLVRAHIPPLYADNIGTISRAEANTIIGRVFGTGDPNLEAWIALYYRYLSPVKISVEALAEAAHVDVRQWRRRVTRGQDLLLEQLQQAEIAAHNQQRRLHLRQYLPPPEQLRLFGIQKHVENLITRLTSAEGPALVGLDGLGGIGKTTLAQAVAEQLAATELFTDILWVSAKQTRLSPVGEIQTLSAPVLTLDQLLLRLATQLGREDLIACTPENRTKALSLTFHSAPYLVIVDNLETMVDHQTLVLQLQSMRGMSHFIFTSRQSLRDYDFVYAFSVPPLSREDSLALLQYELEHRNRWLPGMEITDLLTLYQAVDGIPLALKLLAAQLGRLPLVQILEGLHNARGMASETLYNFIYRHTWDLLQDPARQLLLNMLLTSPQGEDFAWLQATSGLSAPQMDTAIKQLQEYSLLLISGSLQQPLYQLHRLTTTFLQTDILSQW
ncbi:MAG: hypothetical protein JW892_00025 [Anaerolineae bacterium]|nr:hypothetical protein [Anaerolineae bacterium]